MDTSAIGNTRPIPPSAVETARALQPVKGAAQTDEAKMAAAQNSPSNLRNQQNAQILQASMDVSIKSANTSLALLYRTAIDRINEVLTPELGPNAIGNAAAPVQTPEATAGRIVAMTTAFYDAYAGQARNKGKDPDVLAQDFVNLIRGGFEKGFGEAKDILTGLNVMGADSPIEKGINQTYALVMQGYDDFLASKLGTKPAADAAPKDNTAA